MFRCFCLLLAAGFTAVAGATPDNQVLRIASPDATTRQQLGLMFGHLLLEPDTGDVLVEADLLMRDHLARRQIDHVVDTPASAALARELAELRGESRSIPGYACYRTVEQTLDAIDTMVATYPQLAQAVDIGDSWRRTQDPE